MKKYQAGGNVRKDNAQTMDDSSPRNMQRRPRMERQDPLPTDYGEGYTPAPGEVPMRDDREVIPMAPSGRVRRMKAGGAVTRGDGCAMRGKTKGKIF